MNPYLFIFLLGVFITMFLFGAIGLAFRKWYRSPLEKSIKQQYKEIDSLHIGSNEQKFDLIVLKRLAKSTDSGLQSLYEIVRNIDKDVKHLKKKDKIKKKLGNDPVVKDMPSLKKENRTIGGVTFMNCSQGPYSEIPDKNGYIRVNDPEYYYYHGNTMEKPGSTYKQIEFDNGTDMLTIVLNDGRKIASDITYIRDLMLKEANKLQ